jgi:Ankyrin repeats (3 copies)
MARRCCCGPQGRARGGCEAAAREGGRHRAQGHKVWLDATVVGCREAARGGGADVESKDRHGQTPLSWAVRRGDEAVVKLLLEKGANVESKSRYDRMPLWPASERGRYVNLLVDLFFHQASSIKQDYLNPSPKLPIQSLHPNRILLWFTTT